MKKIFLFVALMLCINYCFAQDIVERKNKLTDFVTERYQTIIQTNKQVKQGIYRAFFDKKILIAMGSYVNDKKNRHLAFF